MSKCKKHGIKMIVYDRGGYGDGEYCPECKKEWYENHDRDKREKK